MRKSIVAAGFALMLGSIGIGQAQTYRERIDEKLARYEAHAGAPVQSFNYLRTVSWTPLGREAFAIWTGPNRAWLIQVHRPCSDLDFAQAISLTTGPGRSVTDLDSVILHRSILGDDRRDPGMRCRIREIRPLDVAGLKASEKAARADR